MYRTSLNLCSSCKPFSYILPGIWWRTKTYIRTSCPRNSVITRGLTWGRIISYCIFYNLSSVQTLCPALLTNMGAFPLFVIFTNLTSSCFQETDTVYYREWPPFLSLRIWRKNSVAAKFGVGIFLFFCNVITVAVPNVSCVFISVWLLIGLLNREVVGTYRLHWKLCQWMCRCNIDMQLCIVVSSVFTWGRGEITNRTLPPPTHVTWGSFARSALRRPPSQHCFFVLHNLHAPSSRLIITACQCFPPVGNLLSNWALEHQHGPSKFLFFSGLVPCLTDALYFALLSRLLCCWIQWLQCFIIGLLFIF